MWKKRTGIMLCQPLDEKNLDRNFKTFSYMLAQPKLDGMRCWVQWFDHEPVLWSSEGNPITGVPHIQLLLKDWAKIVGELQFDGELYTHGKAFEDIISTTRRGADNLRDDFADIQYHIFDVKLDKINAERSVVISDAFAKMPSAVRKTNVFVQVRCTTVQRHMVDGALDYFIERGYEGIILRNPLALYVEKRPWTILKWKPSKHDTYQIVGVTEAVSEKGVPLGRVGALNCCDRFGNFFSVGPGLGMTHEVTAKMWADAPNLIGKFAKVYYQNLTDRGVPRFGKFNLVVEATNTDDEVHY